MPHTLDGVAPTLAWSAALATGHASVDAAHQEFIVLARLLLSAADDELLPRLRRFDAHAQQHFSDEDALMRLSSYPSAGCHLDEHRAVLKSIAEVIPRVAAGDCRIARRLADELVRWFPEHTLAMDHGLTRWLFEQATGGGAVVAIHRNLPALAEPFDSTLRDRP